METKRQDTCFHCFAKFINDTPLGKLNNRLIRLTNTVTFFLYDESSDEPCLNMRNCLENILSYFEQEANLSLDGENGNVWPYSRNKINLLWQKGVFPKHIAESMDKIRRICNLSIYYEPVAVRDKEAAYEKLFELTVFINENNLEKAGWRPEFYLPHRMSEEEKEESRKMFSDLPCKISNRQPD